MISKYLLNILLVAFTSCYMSRNTNICYNEPISNDGCCSDSKATYFPFSLYHPYYNINKDELELHTYLIKVDSSLSVKRTNIQVYFLKGVDTIRLNEVEKFSRYSYPNLLNEPELYIHFEYTVEKKMDGSIKEISEDFKLYRCKRTFRSVH
jgi:hypothetical protein